MTEIGGKQTYFNRDISWLYFNDRVLAEAERENVPVLERIKFLSIFSSNLDEFYRVRMPVLLALEKLSNKVGNAIEVHEDLLLSASNLITKQQIRYGKTLTQCIIPVLKANKIHLVYNEAFPQQILKTAEHYFLTQILAFLQPIKLNATSNFFPNNNELYFLITIKTGADEIIYVLNIPSATLKRFFKIKVDEITFVAFLDDIVRNNLHHVFPCQVITGCYSFKVTRDAEIDLKDEYPGSLSDQIEAQLQKRDFGFATRFLHQPGIPENTLKRVKKIFSLKKAGIVEGGNYHNLKDFFDFPIHDEVLSFQPWPKINRLKEAEGTIYENIQHQDLIVHTPYQAYDSVLRFFNEAAIDANTKEIYVTLYRVASDSKIVNALISAAKNGKKVFVLVELKARFDEANNIKWAKKMTAAGVEIVHSVTALKVHAKIALVKREINGRMHYSGLLATGNFNETTASFYTDHILFTTHAGLLREVELLFIFLAKRTKPTSKNLIQFQHLLVAQFNLQDRFLALIQREIEFAKAGKEASITIKLNNLEEKVLIDKLYEASQAGVKITLLVRSICCLIPQVVGQSENIKVIRIVDRYLEHGRIFAFNNLGKVDVFLGSADWMNRNIYRRIEVCFPIYDAKIKLEILDILNLSVTDNVQAVFIDEHLNNIPVVNSSLPNQSQLSIYKLLSKM
ncbi:polyphosphate kinase 1 [Pedobacter changchengzhani]|uniref:Polyphosphate kinase n=1 Tax=Pedobacter changchengzhani TaxID=2529274 RepID=A0A4R5MJS5_9SPHI|nr:polyphosphate kinase 1 [Pedobacter changchengzhani]TDG35884.1 polyphosphate kinase 1 [Pedobacter changchengzhani]